MRYLAGVLLALPVVAEPITFNKDIAPIIFHSCAPCHRPGEAAIPSAHLRGGQEPRLTDCGGDGAELHAAVAPGARVR